MGAGGGGPGGACASESVGTISGTAAASTAQPTSLSLSLHIIQSPRRRVGGSFGRLQSFNRGVALPAPPVLPTERIAHLRYGRRPLHRGISPGDSGRIDANTSLQLTGARRPLSLATVSAASIETAL